MVESIKMINSLGYSLAGALYYPANPGEHPSGILLCHGMFKNHSHYLMERAAERLVRSGFIVMSLDLTGHGGSGGLLTEATLGQWVDDIQKATGFFYQRNIKRLGLLGYSMGGAASILAASIDSRINALALYAPVGHPARLVERFNRKLVDQMMAQNRSYLKTGVQIDEPGYNAWFYSMGMHDTVKAAQDVIVPTLVIHGKLDTVVPEAESADIYKNLATDESVKQRILLKAASHAFRGYAKKLAKHSAGWFEKYLPYESAAVRIWLRHENKYLMVKRSQRMKFFPGKWAPVSGFMDNGNNAKSQSYKEIREELSLGRSHLKFIKSTAKPYEYKDEISDKLWKVNHVLFESKTPKVKLNWEADDYRWVGLDEIEQMDTIPGLVNYMKKFL